MTTRMKPDDPIYEALSAYLDNELQARERSNLEAELKRRPELRRALSELRRTRALLRAQPRMRAPRNFTLTPAMAGVRQGARPVSSAYSTLRLASMLATFFFVLVSVGSLYVQRFGPEPSVVPLAANDNSLKRPGGFGMGGGGGGVVEPPVAMAVPETITESVTVAEEPAAKASEATSTADLEATPVTGAVVAMEQPAEPEIEMQADQPASTPASTNDGSAAQRQSHPITGPLLIGVQVLLALLAVGAGMAAFFLRRAE